MMILQSFKLVDEEEMWLDMVAALACTMFSFMGIFVDIALFRPIRECLLTYAGIVAAASVFAVQGRGQDKGERYVLQG